MIYLIKYIHEKSEVASKYKVPYIVSNKLIAVDTQYYGNMYFSNLKFRF